MEAAAMVECAHILLRAMKDDLAETGTVQPVFILLLEKAWAFVAYDPVLLKSAPGRSAIGNSLQRRANQEEATGALIGIDSYAFVGDPDALRTANQRLVRAATAAGIDALVAAKLGRKSEAITVSLQTPGFHVFLQQLYTRDNKNEIHFGELMAVDSREYGSEFVSAGCFTVFPIRRQARQ